MKQKGHPFYIHSCLLLAEAVWKLFGGLCFWDDIEENKQVVTRFDLELPLSASGAIQFRGYFLLEFYDFGFSHSLGLGCGV